MLNQVLNNPNTLSDDLKTLQNSPLFESWIFLNFGILVVFWPIFERSGFPHPKKSGEFYKVDQWTYEGDI